MTAGRHVAQVWYQASVKNLLLFISIFWKVLIITDKIWLVALQTRCSKPTLYELRICVLFIMLRQRMGNITHNSFSRRKRRQEPRAWIRYAKAKSCHYSSVAHKHSRFTKDPSPHEITVAMPPLSIRSRRRMTVHSDLTRNAAYNPSSLCSPPGIHRQLWFHALSISFHIFENCEGLQDTPLPLRPRLHFHIVPSFVVKGCTSGATLRWTTLWFWIHIPRIK